MDLNYLKKLLKIFDESGANELEIVEEGITIKVSQKPAPEPQVQHYPIMQMPPQQFSAPVQPTQQPTVAAEAVRPAVTPEIQDDEGFHTITSPIVGTFYRSPSPESPPFVEVGANIKLGDTLCIVEAMKLMNEIESDISGTVQKVLIEDSSPVEYGQALFLIKPE